MERRSKSITPWWMDECVVLSMFATRYRFGIRIHSREFAGNGSVPADFVSMSSSPSRRC